MNSWPKTSWKKPNNVDLFSYGLCKGLEIPWAICRQTFGVPSITGAEIIVASVDELSPWLLRNGFLHPTCSLDVFENWSVDLSHQGFWLCSVWFSITKLSFYGTQNSSFKLFQSYLSNGVQQVSDENCCVQRWRLLKLVLHRD